MTSKLKRNSIDDFIPAMLDGSTAGSGCRMARSCERWGSMNNCKTMRVVRLILEQEIEDGDRTISFLRREKNVGSVKGAGEHGEGGTNWT